jgi:biopolymer transport protein ExbD
VFITVPLSYRTDQIVQVGDEPVRVELLHERVRQTLLDQGEKDVYLRGDGEITYQELMSVMDKLKEGGVERVGLIAAPLVER